MTVISMREPTQAERDAFQSWKFGHRNTLRMLFDAAVELHRRYDLNAQKHKLGWPLTEADRQHTLEAEARWADAKRVARHILHGRK